MTNPYILPQGNVLISFSGGRTSGFMLRQIIESNNGIPVRAKVVFANTGREMPETLDFVHECGERWNVPITWLEYARADNKVTFDVVNHNSASRRGEPFDAVLAKTGILPNVFRRFCTQELKVKTIKDTWHLLGGRTGRTRLAFGLTKGTGLSHHQIIDGQTGFLLQWTE